MCQLIDRLRNMFPKRREQEELGTEQRKDLRIVKTQQALTESLKSLFLEKPLTEITVNELCKRAMVRRATFYKHFGDKYELLTFTLKQMQGDISLARDSAPPSSGSGGFIRTSPACSIT